jgi:hypothetical protein
VSFRDFDLIFGMDLRHWQDMHQGLLVLVFWTRITVRPVTSSPLLSFANKEPRA